MERTALVSGIKNSSHEQRCAVKRTSEMERAIDPHLGRFFGLGRGWGVRRCGDRFPANAAAVEFEDGGLPLLHNGGGGGYQLEIAFDVEHRGVQAHPLGREVVREKFVQGKLAELMAFLRP